MPICDKCNNQSSQGKYVPISIDYENDEVYEEIWLCDDCQENVNTK